LEYHHNNLDGILVCCSNLCLVVDTLQVLDDDVDDILELLDDDAHIVLELLDDDAHDILELLDDDAHNVLGPLDGMEGSESGYSVEEPGVLLAPMINPKKMATEALMMTTEAQQVEKDTRDFE